MSWSIEEHIGECRPWPAQVVIYRGETDECLAYVSGEVADQLKAENAKLRELVLDLYRCSDPCNDCPHYNGSNDGFYCDLGIGWKARRMRELGIEATA